MQQYSNMNHIESHVIRMVMQRDNMCDLTQIWQITCHIECENILSE